MAYGFSAGGLDAGLELPSTVCGEKGRLLGLTSDEVAVGRLLDRFVLAVEPTLFTAVSVPNGLFNCGEFVKELGFPNTLVCEKGVVLGIGPDGLVTGGVT